MRTQMVIGMASSSRKGHSKAMKIAAETHGVESVTLAGKDRSLLVVVGDGVDSNALTTKLRRKVGRADLVELHTLHASTGKGGGYYYTPPSRAADYVSSNINGGYGTYPAAATTPGSYVSSSRAAAAEYGGSSKSIINGGYGTAPYPATAAAVSYDAPVPAEYDHEYEYSHKLPSSSSYGGYYSTPLPAPATTYATAPTVVHHEYYPAAGDQNGCCIM